MKSLTKFVLVSLLALVLSACPGSGSGPNPFDGVGSEGGAGGPGDGSDESPVTITISSPAESGTLETPDDSVSLAGTADSNTAIVSVSWTSDKGGEGQATGAETWETDTIPLVVGENTITITAADSAGATASETVVIKRESETAGSVTLNWEPPTTREDGTPLTDLAGYYIHYGRMSETYDYEIKIENPGVVTYVVENLASGTWYFALSAYDSAGLESNFSNEISFIVP